MRKKDFFITIGVLLFVSCNGSLNRGDSGEVLLFDTVESMKKRIREVILNTPDCEVYPGHENCQLIEINAEQSSFNWKLEGADRILIIDEGPILLSTLGKYKQRVLAWYHQSDNGEIEKFFPKKTISRGLSKILHDILGSSSDFIPAKYFSKMTSEVRSVKQFAEDLSSFSLDHGTITFNYLAENNPNAIFIVSSSYFIEDEEYCSKDFNKIKRIIDNSTQTTISMVLENGIKYINMSMGRDRTLLNQRLSLRCPQVRFSKSEIDRILDIESTYYKRLSSITDVTLVQSAVNVSHVIEATPEYNPIDCEKNGYPNRIRVGFVNNTLNEIPPYGANFNQFLNNGLLRGSIDAFNCTDIYVNSGLSFVDNKPGNYPMEITGYGLDTSPMPAMYNSFATPIALSRIINFINYEREKDIRFLVPPEFVLDLITNSGVYKVQDPIRNRQLDIFRLGFL